MKTYFIDHLRPGSINLGDRVKTPFAGTYPEAVTEAHRIWHSLSPKQNVGLYSDSYCLHWWHYIRATGQAEDRNTNGGAVFLDHYPVRYEQGKGYVAA